MVDWNDKNVIEQIVVPLQHDEVVLLASDTVLGLFAQTSEIAKYRLDAIKQRNLKPYIVLISSVERLDTFVDQPIDLSLQKIMKNYWPGPLTIIFKAKSTLPDWLQAADGTIAIRIPDHQGLQDLLQQVDGIFTTSANITDQKLPEKYADIDPLILAQVAEVCCDKNKIYNGKPSTLIDVSTGVLKILRQGPVIIDSI